MFNASFVSKSPTGIRKVLAVVLFLAFLFSCAGSMAEMPVPIKMDVIHDEIPTYMTAFVSQGYSLGESGPVRITFIRNVLKEELEQFRRILPETDEEVYAGSVIRIYDPEMKCYPYDCRFCTDDDFTIESHNDDYSEMIVRFKTPGYYTLLDYANFYVLDPADETLSALAGEMDAMIAQAKEKSRNEKALAQAVYNWIRKKVKYPDKNWLKEDFDKQLNYNDLVGALLGGKTMCVGFAVTTSALMSQAGLHCIALEGMIRRVYEMHEWNLCRIDGEWVHIDTGYGKFALNTDSILKDRFLLDNEYFMLYEWFWSSPADRLLDETNMVIPYNFVM